MTPLRLAVLALSALISSVVAQNRTCGWSKSGCFKDPGTNHPLLISVVPSATEDTTLENCQAACAARNYPYAGTENGYQCWCDYSIAASAATQADSYCNVACFGNTTEMCGGDGSMGIFHNPCVIPILTVTATATYTPTPTAPSVTFSTITVTTTVTPVSTTRTPTPPPTPTPTPSAPVVCDSWLCCIYYPQYCNTYQRASLSSLAAASATAVAKA